MMRTVGALTMTLLIATGTGLTEELSSRVYLSVVSLCGSSQVLESAALSSPDGKNTIDVALTRVAPFFYTGHATVGPGHYLVGARSRRLANGQVGSNCWGGTEISVLPGHGRNVGFEVTQVGGVHYDAHAYLYGALPFTGFVSGTITNDRFDLPAQIDGDAYYIEHAWPGNYVLELSYGENLKCRIAVAVPEQGTGERQDISVQEVQQCLGFTYHIPSTEERGFVPLYVSPSPSTSVPATAPSATGSATAAPRLPVETGNWWLHLARAEKLKVVEGAIDGLINGWWRAYTDYDRKENLVLISAMKSSKDWLSFDKALAKVEAEVKPTAPAYSKHLGYYIDAIDKFYATYPKATAKVTVGEALQCLSDKPWESCAKVAELFSH